MRHGLAVLVVMLAGCHAAPEPPQPAPEWPVGPPPAAAPGEDRVCVYGRLYEVRARHAEAVVVRTDPQAVLDASFFVAGAEHRLLTQPLAVTRLGQEARFTVTGNVCSSDPRSETTIAVTPGARSSTIALSVSVDGQVVAESTVEADLVGLRVAMISVPSRVDPERLFVVFLALG